MHSTKESHYDPKQGRPVLAKERPITNHDEYKGLLTNQSGGIPAAETKTSLNVSLLAWYVGLPLLAAAWAIAGGWVPELQLPTLVLAWVLFILSLFAINAGYHRYWSHQSFNATLLVRVLFAFFGASAMQGSIQAWVVRHRAHHRYHGTVADPFNIAEGSLSVQLLSRAKTTSKFVETTIPAADLTRDSVAALQSALYPALAAFAGLVLPTMVAGVFWGDFWGGLIWAGFIRVVLLTHVTALPLSFGHLVGRKTYNDNSCSRDSFLLSLVTGGEGNQSLHMEFPCNYRLGYRWYHHDPTADALRIMSLSGLVSGLHKYPKTDFVLAKLDATQQKINRLKSKIEFGHVPSDLPEWTWEEYVSRCAAGGEFIVIDAIAHDVSEFKNEHPGGAPMLKAAIGKDATLDFNGVVSRHSKAARNLAAMIRVARVLPEGEEVE